MKLLSGTLLELRFNLKVGALHASTKLKDNAWKFIILLTKQLIADGIHIQLAQAFYFPVQCYCHMELV